jgi:hypothetical protein
LKGYKHLSLQERELLFALLWHKAPLVCGSCEAVIEAEITEKKRYMLIKPTQ